MVTREPSIVCKKKSLLVFEKRIQMSIRDWLTGVSENHVKYASHVEKHGIDSLSCLCDLLTEVPVETVVTTASNVFLLSIDLVFKIGSGV